ncbi:MAG: DUF6390 family protein [Acidimicrobiia bacterium]
MPSLDTAGARRFSRYAYPPHVRGLCGPDDEATITALASGEDADPAPSAFEAFEGAFPYLALIAAETGIGDPLDARVVDGYWLGGPASAEVDLLEVGHHVRDRFRPRMGLRWPTFSEALEARPRPTHGFHVLCVYPWLGMLREGVVQPSLSVLDRCRIRPARVVSVTDDRAEVTSRPLDWAEGRLFLGEPIAESVQLIPGVDPAPGDVVAAHWDWACEVLDERRLGWLLADTTHALSVAARITPTP